MSLPAKAEHWCSFDEHYKIKVHRNPTREELDQEILFLWQVRQACRRAIAQLILLGEELYGQMYVPAQLTTGRAYHTLSSWVRTVRHVPDEIWREDLDWSYHRAVAYKELPDTVKAEYLNRAAANEFESAAEMNKVLREEQGLIDPPVFLTVRCPCCGVQLTDRHCNSHCVSCGAKPLEWASAYWQLRESI
jgi:hypothetical protein